MMSLQSSMHSSQMKTDGPAMSLRTSCWLLPQNEQYSSFSPEELFSDMALHVLPGHENLVHYPVLYRVWRPHEKVAFRVPGDDVDRLGGVLCKNFIEPPPQVQDFLGMDLDVGRLALEAAHRLVDHDARVGQAEALVLVPRGEQKSAHAGRLADAKRADVGLDELHRVVDRQSGGHRAARGVDVEEDVLVRVLRFQEKELRDDQVGRDFGHRPDREHDALLKQPRIDVVGTHAAPRLLNDHRDQPEIFYIRSLFPVQALLPMSSSNATGLSTTLAFDSAHFTTLASSATPSISESRCGCM